MKKLSIFILLTIIICASLTLVSCEIQCGHDYLSAQVIAPTCDTEGYTLNTCTVCKSEFKTNYALPLGHTITDTVFAPTCTEEGYTYYSCPCGYSYQSNKIPPVGHTYESVKVDVTCTSAGYTKYTCTVCGHTYNGDFISATGHDMAEAVYMPDKDSVGYTEHTCKVCDYSYRDSYVFYNDVVGGGYARSSVVLAQGIDVSKWQHLKKLDDSYQPLDWNAIKEAGVDFAILKAGSITGMDPVFEMNYRDARAAGIELGAYFYSYASDEQELDEEISLLLPWLEGKQFEYPIYFDIEEIENAEMKETLTKLCMKFVTVMRENGYYGAVYTGKNYLNTYLYSDVLKGFCDIWYARYPYVAEASLDTVYTWNTESDGEHLGMWQYTSKGKIEGCGIPATQTVDFNYAYKDYPSIIKKYALNGFDNPNIVPRPTEI